MTKMLLIFDLDGTLVDSLTDICMTVNRARAHYGLPPLSRDTVSDYVGDGMRKLMERALQGCNADIEEVLKINFQFYMQHLHDNTIPYPHVIEGLHTLRAVGHTLALLSNKPSQACIGILRHFKIEDLFAEIIGGGHHIPLKPDPEPVLAIMRKTGFKPDCTWMIGHSRNDIEAGRRAGTKSAFVTYGIGKKDGASPDKKFDTFEELMQFFADA